MGKVRRGRDRVHTLLNVQSAFCSLLRFRKHARPSFPVQNMSSIYSVCPPCRWPHQICRSHSPSPFDFFFSLVMWVEMAEMARLRLFLGGDMGGAGLLRVLDMAVETNDAAVTGVTERDNITSRFPAPFLHVGKQK